MPLNAPLSEQSLGVLIDLAAQVRDRRRELKAQVSDLFEQYEALTAEILKRLDEGGMPKASGTLATASIAEEELFSIDDFDVYEQFIYDNNALYLMQRRPAQAAIRELKKAGTEVPGVRAFTKRSINLRKSPT